MSTLSKTLRKFASIPTTVLLAGYLATAPAQCALAADLSFLCSAALKAAMEELIPEFEKTSGHAVKTAYANITRNTERLRRGNPADLAIISAQQWENLNREGKIDPGVRVIIGKVGAGACVKKGASRPNIGSVETFKRTVLNARSIALGDPGHGAPIGSYVMGLFDRLGIADEIRPRITLIVGGQECQAVARGEAEIGFSAMTEIVGAPGVDPIGPLPAEVQFNVVLTAAMPIHARQPDAVKALLEFLTSSRAVSVFKSRGLEPG